MPPELLQMCPLHPAADAALEAAFQVHRAWQAADRDALIAQLAPRVEAMATIGHERTDAALMDRLPGLRLIASFGVGYDGIDVDAARRRGIAVTNTPDVLNECVADNAWALILATVRRTAYHDRFVRAGLWLKGNAALTDRVWGENLGIIGLGRIGQAIAHRAKAFGMHIGYHTRSPRPQSGHTYFERVEDLAAWSRILVVACPGGAATRGIVSAGVLGALGREGYLINIARGSTIDEPALVEALAQGRIAGAGLDVFTDEPRVPEALFALDNVTLQPHTSSGTHHTRAAMGQLVVDNLLAHFAGRPLLTPV